MNPLVTLRRAAALCVAMVVLVATPRDAFAIADYTGDIFPAESSFGTFDRDGDGLVTGIDGIDDLGNNVFTALVDPLDPNAPPPFTFGLPWNDPQVWIDYESPQNIRIGEIGFGLLSITAGTSLRYQHLVLGGGGSLAFNEGGGGGDFNNFNFINDLQGNQMLPTSGTGVLNVTGIGSVFNNDPALIPTEFQEAIRAAEPGWTIADGVPADDAYVRESDIGFDVHVGLLGNGELAVSSAGRVEIQDALFVGLGSDSQGTVTVTGVASVINAAGRESITAAGESTPSMELPSIVGGGGIGTMNIREGGTVNMFNGAALGFIPEGQNAQTPPDESGTGTVVVEGAGSSWNVYASNAMQQVVEGGGPGNQAAQGIALAIGGIPQGLGGVVDESLGVGFLRITDNGRVNVRRAPESYIGATQNAEANVVVGVNGTLDVAGGTLEMSDNLQNGGDIIMAGGLIQGNNADAGQPDQGGGNPIVTVNRFLNQGDVDGFGTMRFERVENALGATINGGGFSADQQGQVIGGPLRILVADAGTDVGNEEAAFSNRGQILGDVDIEVAGSFENGDTPANTVTGLLFDAANGGVIEAAGRIQSSLFFNRRFGRVSVGPGQSLSILSSLQGLAPRSDLTLLRDGLSLNDGRNGSIDTDGNANYFQANLGSIAVDSGTLEVGRQTAQTTVGPIEDRVFEDMFLNARYYDDMENQETEIGEVTGVITVRDGDVTFRSGLYNTGVLSFTDGQNIIRGDVINGGQTLYGANDAPIVREGVIDVSGVETVVTFENDIYNAGDIVVGAGNQLNVLGNLDTREGDLRIAAELGDVFDGTAPITVQGDAEIGGLGGGLSVFGSNVNPDNLVAGFSITLLSATSDLLINGAFGFVHVPTLPSTGVRWVVVPDLAVDELRLEIVDAGTPSIGDANLDGIVDVADYAIWANA